MSLSKRVKGTEDKCLAAYKCAAHENSEIFGAGLQVREVAQWRRRGWRPKAKASRLRLSLAFGARKNVRSSPPSAKKNDHRSFWSRRASAQPTAGRPSAGRPEAVRVGEGGGRRSAVWRAPNEGQATR